MKSIIKKMGAIAFLCIIAIVIPAKEVEGKSLITYNHGVSCRDCGDCTRATERVDHNSPRKSVTSITLTMSDLDSYTHELIVNGRAGNTYGDYVTVGSVTRSNVKPGYYEIDWGKYYDYYGEKVKAKFTIRKYGNEGTMTSLWEFCN